MSARSLQVTPGPGCTEFLLWSFNSSLGRLHGSFRWTGWQCEVSALSGEQALSVYPPLVTKEGRRIASGSRTRCPVSEIYDLNVIHFPKQPNG